jgi:hypothetical protein
MEEGEKLNTRRLTNHVATYLLLILILFACLSDKLLILAQSGPTLTSECTTVPTIDGFISPGEWNDAASENITLAYIDVWPNTTMHEATLYVKNDATYLYLAAVVKGDDYDLQYLDYGVWWFDNDHDGVIEFGDDGLVISSDGLTMDVYRQNPIGRQWAIDTYDGGTDDLIGAVNHTNTSGIGDYTFEYRHPLNTEDDAHDFSLKPGDTVGFKFQYFDSNGGTGDDVAYSLVQTTDGGYALAGWSDFYGTAGYEFWVVKTDPYRYPEKSLTYGGESLDSGWSIIQTSDGGYALAGYTQSYGAGSGDFWLIKIDQYGGIEWSQTYGGPNDDAASTVIQTSDGGYALAGYTDSYGAGGHDFWLVKTNQYGEMEWRRTYGGPYNEIPYSLVQTSDGGFALAGFTGSYSVGINDFWLVKTDPSGNMIFNVAMGGSEDEIAYSVIQTSDDGFVLAGYTGTSGAGAYDFWLVKTDEYGDTEWSQTYGGLNNEIAYSLVQTTDGGYALAGYTESFGAGGSDVWLVKTDPYGNWNWNQTYNNDFGLGNAEIAYSLIQTSDGGYALAGSTQFFSADGYDFWLVKTDSTGAKQWDWAYQQAARAQWPNVQSYGSIGIFNPSPTSTRSSTSDTQETPTQTEPPTQPTPGQEQKSNNPPIATIVSIEPGSAQMHAIEGELVTFKGSGSDSDGFVVGYRWISSIDGLLSEDKDFSTSHLSVGTHTIYFEVQDNDGIWSISATHVIIIEPATALNVVLIAITIGFIGSAGAGTLIQIQSRLKSSLKIRNKLKKRIDKETRKKKKEEKDKDREIDKGKPYLQLNMDFPLRIMSAASYKARLKIKNIGARQAQSIIVANACTPGLLLSKTSAQIPALQPGEERSLVFPFTTSEKIKKGVYMDRVDVKSKEALGRVRNCYTRAVKIGLLLDDQAQKYAEPFQRWLKEKAYRFDRLDNAENLVRGLLKYDLIVLLPDLELPKKWIHNISSFVRNGQSLWVIDRIATSEKQMLANILGYSDVQFKLFECDQHSIRICNEEHCIWQKLALDKEIQIGKSWGNVCISGKTTGVTLAEHHRNLMNKSETSTAAIPAITINEYGKGKVVHFNFHAEESVDQLDKILEKTFDWLLS